MGAGAHTLGPSSVFLGALTGSWLGMEKLELKAALMGCQHHRWQLDVLCHSASRSAFIYLYNLLKITKGWGWALW